MALRVALLALLFGACVPQPSQGPSSDDDDSTPAVADDDDSSSPSDDDDSTPVTNDDDSSSPIDDDDATPPCETDNDGDGAFDADCGGDDCDDDDPDIHPAAAEVCADGIDNNCDGTPVGCGLTGMVGPSAADHVLRGGWSSSSFGGSLLALPASPPSPQARLVVSARGISDWQGLHWYEYDGLFSLGGSTTNQGSSSMSLPRWLAHGGGDIVVTSDPYHQTVGHGEHGAYLEVASLQTGANSFGATRESQFSLLSQEEEPPPPWGWCFEGSWAAFRPDGSSFNQAQIRSCGDLTGDGTPDFCLGAHGDPLQAGYGGVWVFDAAQLPLEAGLDDAVALVEGETYCGAFGVRFDGGDDLSGDGQDDLVVTAPDDNTTGYSTISIFHGPLAGAALASTADARILGGPSHGTIGRSFLEAADVNGDGVADVVADVWVEAAPDEWEWRLWVWLGPFSGDRSSLDRDFEILPRTDGLDVFGGFSSAGDVDADGHTDFLVQLGQGPVPASARGTCLLYGPLVADTPMDDAQFCVTVGNTVSWFGSAVAGGVDFDGDGFDDFAVGEPLNWDISDQSGAVHVFFGQPRLL